jgi:hypothetical protein
VATPTAATLAARSVVVNRDTISYSQAVDSIAERADDSGRLVAEHCRELALHIPIDYVGRAHAARQHVAHDLARAGRRVFDVLDLDVVKRD